jgi:uncharacterized protein (DUF362 family)
LLKDEASIMRKFHIEPWSAVDKEVLTRALEAVGRLDGLSSGSRVFIKPNFTFPFFKEGVTTPPDLIRGLVEILAARGADITIGEAGASLDVFNLHNSFAAHGLYDLQKEFGIRVVHLREDEIIQVSLGRSKLARSVPLPRRLLENTDVFMTLPLAKVHAMTGVSLGIKNQWGCIAAEKRFLFHPAFNEILYGLHELLPPQIVVCDGRYVLTDNGPMFGTPRPGRFLAVANDIGTFDVAMCRLMGVDPKKIGHISYMMKRGAAPGSWAEIELNCDPAVYRPCEFTLNRTLQNYIALAGFHSSLITRFGYDSLVSDFLHRILYTIKPNPLEKEMKEWGKNERPS